jgi:nicotinate phosphoribosyltransferase
MIQRGGPGSAFVPRIKLSEQAVKLSNPGVQQVRRFSANGRLIADVIYDETQGEASAHRMVDPLDPTRQRVLGSHYSHEDLLVPVWQSGRRLTPPCDLQQVRAYAHTQLARLDPTVRRLLNPHEYPVGLSRDLYAERLRLVQAARQLPHESTKELV